VIRERATTRRSRVSSSARRRHARICAISSAPIRRIISPRSRKAIALRTRLTELERQIGVQRETSRKAALVDAQEELASATAAAARIQGQIASGRVEVGQFTARLNEYKSRQDDLTELEKTYREATQKQARLEASERARMPAAKMIEAASTPREPWRPLIGATPGIAAGGSLLLALLAMWLVELFNRTQPQPSVVVVRTAAGRHVVRWQIRR
jgi:uncharacterized protein involved in exopolysaccharide biosynthesis